MSAYDGSDFVGLDGACYAGGAASGQPLDTWLHQRILGNQRLLSGGVDGATCVLAQQGQSLATAISANTGDRPWASVRWSMPVRIPFLIQPGMTGVRINCLWACYSFGTTAVGVDIEWRLIDGRGRTLATTGQQNVPPTLDWGDQSALSGNYELTLSAPWSGVQETGTLALRIKSRRGDATGTTHPLLTRARYVREDADHDLNYDANGPVSGDVGIISLDYTGETSSINADIMAITNNTSPTNDLIYLDQNERDWANLTFSEYHLGYLQCRAIQVLPRYDIDSIGGVSESELWARQPVESSEQTRLAQHPASYADRARLRAWGPPGKQYTGAAENWPTRYHERFNRVDASGINVLIDETLMLAASCTVEVVFDVIGTYIADNQIGAGISEVNWEFYATVDKFDAADTTWDTPTTLATGPTLERALTHNPYLIQPRPAYQGQTATTFQFIEVHATDGSPREGQLFDGDEAIVQRLSVTVAVTAPDQNTPLRLRVYTDAILIAPDIQALPLYTREELSRLTCTGYTIYTTEAE